MSSYSGLNAHQRILCRDRVVQAALLGYHHRDGIGYTQGAGRWSGINQHRNARVGQYPPISDCSAYDTWCLWNGLHLGFGLGDIVNGTGWSGGFTGTMLDHGHHVAHESQLIRADCVIYGGGYPGEHVALVVGHHGRTPMVVSHGGPSGPLYLPFNYRPDVLAYRRYV